MSERTNNIPKIRFKGFKGEWEMKTLNKHANKIIEKNIKRKYSETLTNSAEFGIISQRDYFDKDISNAENIHGYYIVSPDCFVYNPRISVLAPVGPVNRNTLGRTGVMSPLYTVFRTKDVDNTFLEYFFKTNLWHPFMFLNGDTGARADRFSIKDAVFMELPIPYPVLIEQQKIGTYFRQLDELLGQQQRKYDKLLMLKKAMLQKMFPQPGATTPEIRFKGFKGEWEMKKLGELAIFSKGRGYSKSDLSTTGSPIVLYGRLYTNYQTEISKVDTYTNAKKDEVKSKGGEVIVPSSGEAANDIARASVIVEKGIILGGDLNIVTPFDELESCFLALTLSYGDSKQKLAQKAQGKSVVHLSNSDLQALTIPLPSRSEQQKIGGYFRELDELIGKHAMQLEKLKQIKSACLERMFV